MTYKLVRSATRPTIATVDLNAFESNVLVLKKHAESDLFLAVIKTNAYGHGLVPIAKAALKAGANRLGITTLEEGIELREQGIDAPLLLLSGSFTSQVDYIIAYDLTASISSIELAKKFSMKAVKQQRLARLHLKVDTGLHRFGLFPNDALDFCKECYDLPGLHWEGIFTHFSDADDGNWEKTKRQFDLFNEVIMILKQNGFVFPIRHVGGSTIAVERPDMHLDMVRPGISLFGYHPSPKQKPLISLKPVMELTTKVLNVKDVSAGTTVGYGGNYLTKEDKRLAILPIGLGDGYSRTLSNKGYVLVKGERAPIIGNISLDQTVIDVTGISGVKESDDVVLIGKMGEEAITAEDIADWMGSIVDEVLACFTERIPRVYI